MAENVSRRGGATGYREGILKYCLPEISTFFFGGASTIMVPIGAVTTQKLWLRGLSPNLAVRIAVGIVGQDSRGMPAYPALPGVCQVTPCTMTTQGAVLYQHPLNLAPQTLPAAFMLAPSFRTGDDGSNPVYGISGCDAALIAVTIDPAQYATSLIVGNLLVTVTAEYVGPWWDIEAIQKLMGQLDITSVDGLLVGTGGS